jgi:small ligand-binding sensory domain FIST
VRWASAVSTADDLDEAVAAVTGEVRDALDDAAADLALVFVSEGHQARYGDVPALVRAGLAPRILAGCSAGGVIGGGREVEHRTAVALTAAHVPNVAIAPFHVATNAVPSADDVDAWTRLVRPPPARPLAFVVLPDPFSIDAERLVRGLDTAFPGSTTIGGIASGGREPESGALFLGADVERSGAVGIALAGDLVLDTIVAQGCRPIGDPMFVTRADRQLLLELDGRRPVEVLAELLERLDPRDQELARRSLFLGLVMRPQHEYRQGDFLIRNLIGLDSRTGALAIGALLAPGTVVQFHLRDAETSRHDLEALLARYQPDGAAPAGSLLFSCLGRGAHLYGRPDHDTEAFHQAVGAVPLGGFFCNGEIGPVHGTTFVHGYTSAFGVFRPRGT